ncbi:MAG: FAD-linked oxidase C-terminal domain-containing protein [Steroidobacteraceae bacterium]
MSVRMPAPDPRTLASRAGIVAAMREIVQGEGVIDQADELAPYESDALTAYAQRPLLVVLPETTGQICAILRWCNEHGVRVVPRGAGTSLSGGALPSEDGIVLALSRLRQILEIDYDNRIAVVQPGVTNLAVSQAVAARGFYYAPDPSSQIACTIGGNVAENSGGVHCLKYGMTAHNVLGLKIVLMSGEVIELGGKALDSPGYDLLGLAVGSEGLLGVVSEITLRLLVKPQAAQAVLIGFSEVEQAARCVAEVIAHGIIPAGMEMMDRPAIHAAEDFLDIGYPRDVDALLIVEVDGPEQECRHLMQMVTGIAARNGAATVRVSGGEEERLRFWAGRKAAFPAIGRISPDYYCIDGTIPRRCLPEMLKRMSGMAVHHRLRVANVFHAGDGNLHPLILYDANVPGELDRAEAFAADILRTCVAMGGVLTGEHGVGVEKRDLMGEMFNDVDLQHQERIKNVFDPAMLLNPGKVFPNLHRCAELGRMHVHQGQLRFPDIPRF